MSMRRSVARVLVVACSPLIVAAVAMVAAAPAYALDTSAVAPTLDTTAVTDPLSNILPSAVPSVRASVNPIGDGSVDGVTGNLPAPVSGLLPKTSPPGGVPDGNNGNNGGSGARPDGSGSGGTGNARAGTGDAGSKGDATRAPGSTSAQAPAVDPPYGSLAGHAIVKAAGRAFDLAGPLAPPMILAGIILGLFVALSRGSNRLVKVEQVTSKRTYRI